VINLSYHTNRAPGQQASLTYIATPALLESPAPLLAKQWKKAFEISTAAEGFTAITLGGVFSYLAYRGTI